MRFSFGHDHDEEGYTANLPLEIHKEILLRGTVCDAMNYINKNKSLEYLHTDPNFLKELAIQHQLVSQLNNCEPVSDSLNR